ncbi:GGDEF domain-containing protein [Mycolicibacterium grossiae]|uniref:GGDEF domain-containing protein n=1 Tax=Mycolicibacterium grossiae TaxID=1552759 RepID=A0A1E8PX39_9MYCO|nr:hypothetical protein BEL07_26570 [Mycolicibacterium grossiae]QEM46370.1 GGDEF domain-containing protein [Mycolicibacterium grossiae]
MEWLGRWWRQPDHYDWLSAYLTTRGLQRVTRAFMVAVMAALGAAPLVLLLSPHGPQGHVARGLSLAAGGACLVMAVAWAARWPTRGQSLAFVMVADAGIAAACLVQPAPGGGLQACTAFAVLGGYVAFFHTSRTLLLVVTTALTTAAVSAVHLVIQGGVYEAVSKLLIVSAGVVAAPFAAHVLVHFLGIDALRSDVDPLTDLLNRRGFHRSMRALVAESVADRAAVVSAVMIDLDAFKRVNDTSGHATGDQILVEVAEILRRTRRGDSVIGRIGGEEFVVGVVGARRDAVGLAERMRHEIAATPWRVTASVGVASASVTRVPDEGIRSFVQGLLESADRAMYAAKRDGGDRVRATSPAAERTGARRPSVYPDGFVERPTPSRTTASSGKVPWTIADRAFDGAEANSTIAAAAMDPAPAKTSAAPTAVPPEIVTPTPTAVTTARKRL